MTNNEPSSRGQKIIWIYVFVGAMALSFGVGAITGMAIDLHRDILNKASSVNISKVINLYGKTRSTEVDFNQFWAIWDKVKNKYVSQPVDDTKLFYGALSGIVQGLNDPYSVYFPPTEAESFAKDLAGELEGIGAEIGIKDSVLVVIAPLPDSPAEQAGLRPGDKILAIDGKESRGLSLEEAVSRIRGASGSSVKLTVAKDGFDEIKEVSIVRKKISIPTVITEKKDNRIAYIRVTYFNQDTWASFDKQIKKVLAEKPSGIIFDLRSNPGGFLETAIDIASEWVKDGIIVSERQKDGISKEHSTRGMHRLAGVPTVVLVDGGSASASEIVAGALQDYGVAKLVGQKTYGKGSVQDFEMLPDGSALKLTIAKWYTPKNRQIDQEGIMPDIAMPAMFSTSTKADLGLEKAIEILQADKK